MNRFESTEAYYAVLFHELVHSTGVELKQFKEDERDSGGDYSREELVAEIGSCYLQNLCGMNTETRKRQSSAYISGWLKHLTDNKKDFTSACTRAEKAVKFILGELELKEE